jgi:hypothetical protein
MDVPDKTAAIEELDATQQITTTGGEYPDIQFGLVAGIAASAGILASGGVLGVAFAVGCAVLYSRL